MLDHGFGAGTLVDAFSPADENLDRDLARRIAQRLRGTGHDTELLVRMRSGHVETLPSRFTSLIASMLEELAAGHAVTLISHAEEVTTSTAAAFLGVSRPHVVAHVDIRNALLPPAP